MKLTTDLLVMGAAVVRGVPKAPTQAFIAHGTRAQEHGVVVEFGKNLSTLRQTEWGAFFNVRTKPDAALGAAKPLVADLFGA